MTAERFDDLARSSSCISPRHRQPNRHDPTTPGGATVRMRGHDAININNVPTHTLNGGAQP